MALLAVNLISRAGFDTSTIAQAAAAGGDNFANDGSQFLYIEAGGTGVTVTLVLASTALIDGQAPASRTVVVAINTHVLIGPFPIGAYNDVNGRVNFTYTQVVTIKVACLKLGT